MNIKQLFKMGKKFTPLVPVFGGWKVALVVFAVLQYLAPLALKGLNQLQANLEAKGNESAA